MRPLRTPGSNNPTTSRLAESTIVFSKGRSPNPAKAIRRSDRVLITSPTAADCNEFTAAAIASRALHHPWVFPPETPEAFGVYLDRIRREDNAGFLLRRTEDGVLAGMVNANNIVFGSLRSAYLGYAAFAGSEGRGLMAEGLRLVIAHLFEDLGLHRVEANIQPANERSRRLVEGLGFEREGYSKRYLFIDGDWRDHERWALRVEDADL